MVAIRKLELSRKRVAVLTACTSHTSQGPNFVNQNTNQPAGFIYDVIHGGDPFGRGNGAQVDWYAEYCEAKPTKACMLSEAGAAWHSNPNLVATADNTQVELQRAWWNDGPLNQTFLAEHPRLRAYFQFEYDKFENDGGIVDERDYRITNNTAVLSAFRADMSAVSTAYVWANATTTAAPNTSAFEITPSGPVATATITVNQTSAVVATYTQFVSVFGFLPLLDSCGRCGLKKAVLADTHASRMIPLTHSLSPPPPPHLLPQYSGPFVNVSYVGTADPLASPTGTSTLPASVLTGLGAAAGNGNGEGGAAAATSGTPSLFNGAATQSLQTVRISTILLSSLLVGAAAALVR